MCDHKISPDDYLLGDDLPVSNEEVINMHFDQIADYDPGEIRKESID